MEVLTQTGSDVSKEKELYHRIDTGYPTKDGKIDWILGHWEKLGNAPVH